MRILITTGIFKPEPGGPATYSAELGKRLHSAGHEVILITYSDKPHFDLDDGYTYNIIRVVRSPSKLKNYLKFFWAAFKHMRRADIVYSLDWFSAGVPVMLASFLRKKKYIVRVGGGYIWEKYLSEGRSPMPLKDFYEKKIYKQYKVMYWLIWLVLHRAAHVVFNSDEQRELYQKFYSLKPQKISTIHNPVPESKFGTLVHTYKENYHQRDKEIIFAGRFIKMKNVEALIAAFSKLNDPIFKLTLIGEGPTEPILRQMVTDLHLEDRVEFHPSMSQTELYRRIVNSYLFVIPSWTDISPNQVYECMSLGIPFLLTKENYLTINRQSFLKIDPTSVDDIALKMNQLLDPKEYAAFVESLSHLSFHHTWHDVVLEHMRLFTHYVKK
jgi:glycosyltransferase involved in cell wall biosynthesis